MIREIRQNEINDFINFDNFVYRDDSCYVPYIRSDLKKTIKRLVFEKGEYKALCSFDSNGKINARALLTVGKNKQLNTDKCGYFSHFEVINDKSVFDGFTARMEAELMSMGAEYILGSFFPHDPDNRRGILIAGFEKPPMIFTSHNPPYYKQFFEDACYKKLVDANEYEYAEEQEITDKIKCTAEKAVIENDIHISRLDLHNIDRDIKDVHTVMEKASTEINFEHVLSENELKSIFKSWKMFINRDYALIARKNSDNSPVGFTLSIPNYFELIEKTNGKINLRLIFLFIFKRKKIKGLRAMLQYIIPEYQHKGVSKALYYETKKAVDKNGVERISLGTMMENNAASNGAVISLGGHLSKVYRIYFKKLL